MVKRLQSNSRNDHTKIMIYVPSKTTNPMTTALPHISKYEGNKHSPNMIVKIRQTDER